MNVIDQSITDEYAIYNGDSCEVIKAFDDESIGYIIYSPPFDSLYTYSIPTAIWATVTKANLCSILNFSSRAS